MAVHHYFTYYNNYHFHSVCYIASELMKHLMSDPDSRKAYDDFHNGIDYEMCVKVAALCHDLG